MRAMLFLWEIEYKGETIPPPDMANVLCVDSNGRVQTAVMARLLYGKWKEDVLALAETNGTCAALVDITFTERGISHCLPIAITADEAMVIEKVVDLVLNRADSIPKDGKIPKEMRWAPSRIVNTAVQYAEMQKEHLLDTCPILGGWQGHAAIYKELWRRRDSTGKMSRTACELAGLVTKKYNGVAIVRNAVSTGETSTLCRG